MTIRHPPSLQNSAISRRNARASHRRADPGDPSAAHAHHHGCACGGVCPRCSAARKNTAPTASEPAPTLQTHLGPGSPLPSAARAEAETRLGALGEVRLHTDSRAAALGRYLGADAFALGRDVGIARPNWNPATPSGMRLLQHELAHVKQSGDAALPADHRLPIDRQDSAAEHHAFAAENPFATGRIPLAAQPAALRLRPAGPEVDAVSGSDRGPGAATTATTGTSITRNGSSTDAADGECSGWFSDPQSLSKQVAEHYVKHDVTPPVTGTVQKIECGKPIASGAYGCVVTFSSGEVIRVIVRKDVIHVGFSPIVTTTPPKERPLCIYDFRCPPPNRELVLIRLECLHA